jgi:hypothetical protein
MHHQVNRLASRQQLHGRVIVALDIPGAAVIGSTIDGDRFGIDARTRIDDAAPDGLTRSGVTHLSRTIGIDGFCGDDRCLFRGRTALLDGVLAITGGGRVHRGALLCLGETSEQRGKAVSLPVPEQQSYEQDEAPPGSAKATSSFSRSLRETSGWRAKQFTRKPSFCEMRRSVK